MRIALLGCGAIGEIVAREVYARSRNRGFAVVAVIDREEARARAIGSLVGAPHFASLARALETTKIEGLDIRLPHGEHAPAAVEALESGLHVLVEKPLSTSLKEAERITDCARRRDRVVAVAENYPHLSAVISARRAIDEGAIGQVLTVRTTRAFTLSGVWAKQWRTNVGPSSGILFDQGTHHASLLRHLCGDIATVAAQSSAGDSGDRSTETVVVSLRFRSGQLAHSLYCWGTPAVDPEVESVVYGTEGRLTVSVDYGARGGGATVIDRTGAARQISAPENYYESHGSIIRDWVRCVRDGGTPRVTAADGMKDLAVVVAARKSAALDGAVVPIDGLAD